MDRGTEWPNLRTSLQDHGEFNRRRKAKDPELMGMSGKAFRSVNTRGLDTEVRRSLVNVKLPTSKKAGTASNQAASAATAWLVHGAAEDFRSVTMTWAGEATHLLYHRLNIMSTVQFRCVTAHGPGS